MNPRSARYFFLIVFFAAAAHAGAQVAPGSANVADTQQVRISSIDVFGNKRTKTRVILREIQFDAGDTLLKKDVPNNFRRARSQVFNTNLFTEVKLDSTVLADSALRVNVFVKEKWYIYPTPQFQFADRNFNVWLKTYHAALNRVIYGAKFADYNFSGRRDQLRVFLLNGYARNITLAYSNPYVNKKLTSGIGFSTGFTQNREIPLYTSYNNQTINYKTPGFVQSSFNTSGSYTYRRGFFKTFFAGAALTYIDVNDSVLYYNPNYFGNSRSHQFIPDFSAGVSYTNTDNNHYPLRGLVYGYSISKRGFKIERGLDNVSFQGNISKTWPMGHNFYSNLQVAGVVKLPFDEGYINQHALGYGGFTLRGLEYYVIDGSAAGIAKYTLSKKLFSFRIPLPFKLRTVPYLPFTFYGKTYGDAGYSYALPKYTTMLNNRFLYTGGFGLDVITFYNIVLRLEYSFNQLGEKGLFLHGSSGF